MLIILMRCVIVKRCIFLTSEWSWIHITFVWFLLQSSEEDSTINQWYHSSKMECNECRSYIILNKKIRSEFIWISWIRIKSLLYSPSESNKFAQDVCCAACKTCTLFHPAKYFIIFQIGASQKQIFYYNTLFWLLFK